MNLTITDFFGDYNLSPQERMRLIKEAGFSGIIGLLWTGIFNSDYKSFPEYAGNAGLYIENIHAPWQGASELWFDNLNGQNFMEEILDNIKVCSNYGIRTLVMHPEHKNGTVHDHELPDKFNIGLERLKIIVDMAERFNINIAVENMCRPEYLECIFKNIRSKRIGFCFDSGHWNVFMPDIDLLTLYGDRLMALHLHDNDGKEDWHALPLSGNINWNNIANKLKEIKYNGSIALEVGNKTLEYIKEPNEFLRVFKSRLKRS